MGDPELEALPEHVLAAYSELDEAIEKFRGVIAEQEASELDGEDQRDYFIQDWTLVVGLVRFLPSGRKAHDLKTFTKGGDQSPWATTGLLQEAYNETG